MALINGIGFSTDVMNSLDMSTHVTSVTQSMYRCIDSQYMTANRFTAILKHCWMLSNWQVNSYFGTATNNWATFATGSVYNLIARFPELAVHDEWLERVRADNTRVLSGGTFEDGLCIELSHNYISTILGTYATPLSTSRATGEEVPYDDELYQSIHDTVMSLIYTSGPYFGGFNQADGYDPYTSYKSTFTTWYNFQLFDEPALEYLATDGARGSMPENPTTHYPAGMKTFMRSGWDQNSLQLAFINNVRPDSSHGHKDALSLAMFAYGKYLLTDQGYGSLQTGDAWSYMKSPVQHNVVTVNDIEDWLTEGTVTSVNTLGSGYGIERAFESNKQYDFVEYATELYTTTKLSQRSVLFLRDAGFWIVTDYHVPNDETANNLFAQHWHMYPGSNMSYDETFAVRSNFSDVNVKVVPLEYGEVDEVRLVDTWYSEKGGQMQDSQKAMILKTKTGAGRFTTAIMPMQAGEDMNVESTVIDVKTVADQSPVNPDLVNAVYFRVTNTATNAVNYYYYYHINDEAQKQDVQIGEFSTDATTLLVQKNATGDLVSAFMMGGSYLKSSQLKNEYLIKTEEPVASISYKKSGTTMNVASSTLTEEELANMTLYADGATSVYLSSTGSTVDSKKQGGYFYFGDEPILDVEDEPDTPDDDNTGGTGTGDRNQGVNGGGTSNTPGGGSGTPGTGTPQTPVTPVDPTPSTATYSDVPADSWYYNAVEALTEQGIVSGDGTGLFHPEEQVTREQFLKMLLIAMGTELSEAENPFTDVIEGEWYVPYVLTAKKLGVVTGISETVFGIGEQILRQDMAVMINRMLEGKEIPWVNAVPFDDADEVSEYAAEAVANMKRMALIEGYDNRFNPQESLTRAEAASVIAKLTETLKSLEAQ